MEIFPSKYITNDIIMNKIKLIIKNTIINIAILLPFGRDIYLILRKKSQGISYRGCFETFEQAKLAASRNIPNNYDVINANKAKRATLEKQHLDHRFLDIDYPLLFWISKLLSKKSKVLELGGSLGHFFYSIQKYIPLPRDLIWTIVELPEAIQFGQAIALERKENRLFFQTEMNWQLLPIPTFS